MKMTMVMVMIQNLTNILHDIGDDGHLSTREY